MALTTQQIETIAREFGQKIFVQANVTATSDFTALKAAVEAIDTAMDATFNQAVNAGFGTTKVKLGLLQQVQTAAPNLTVAQAGLALALWALNEVS